MTLYFQGYGVSLKQSIAIIPFFKDIELIRNSSCSHPLMNSKIKEQMQSNILSNLLYFCRAGIVARRYHSY